MSFPASRPRRLRRTETIRALVRETRLSPDDLIAPLFVCPGEAVTKPIGAMPGCAQMSADRIVSECRELSSLGVRGVILFGIPERKDPEGTGALDENGPVPRAIRTVIKREAREQQIADLIANNSQRIDQLEAMLASRSAAPRPRPRSA